MLDVLKLLVRVRYLILPCSSFHFLRAFSDMAELNMRLHGGHTSSALCVDARDEGTEIISGGESGEICLWNNNGELKQKISTEIEDCTSIYICKTKEHNFYASLGNSVKLFDTRNLSTPVETYQFNEEEVNQIVLDEKEGYLAACDDAGEVKIISLQEKRLYKTLRRKHTNICATVCFRVRKPWEVFTGGMDCNLIHWDFSRPKCMNQFNMQELQDAPSELGAYMVNPPFVHQLAMSPDGKYLASALENGFVSVFDASKKNIAEICTLHAHTQGVSQVSFVSASKLITAGNDCVIASWDLSKMHEDNMPAEHLETNGHSSPIHSEVSENCKLSEVQHTSKINWMKHFTRSEENFVILADQTSDLIIVSVQI